MKVADLPSGTRDRVISQNGEWLSRRKGITRLAILFFSLAMPSAYANPNYNIE